MKTTIGDVAQTIAKVSTKRKVVQRGQVSIADNLRSEVCPVSEGLHTITPAQAASIVVDRLDVNGMITGYQRDHRTKHVRDIAKAMEDGHPIPPAQCAINEEGQLEVIDGQHRLLASIASGVPVKITVEHMDAEERRMLFAGQIRAKKVDPSTLILAGDGPVESYVQDAVTDPTQMHPWSSLLTGTRKISPAQAHNLISMYVIGRARSVTHMTSTTISREQIDREFSAERADELAMLITAFGDARTNPPAFSAVGLRAITGAATVIIRNSSSKQSDITRWLRHMPKFAWHRYPHLRSSKDIAGVLVEHWNARLRSDRRIAW
jgi:hypothetical protein